MILFNSNIWQDPGLSEATVDDTGENCASKKKKTELTPQSDTTIISIAGEKERHNAGQIIIGH